MNWKEYIVSDKDIFDGRPIIKGTRLSVEFILERLADGWSEDEVLQNYPRLSKESLQAIFSFVSDCMKDNIITASTLQAT